MLSETLSAPAATAGARAQLRDGPVKNVGEVSAAYSSKPWWYDLRGFFILTFSYRNTLWSQVRFFARNVRERHLEAGVGTGTLFKMVLRWRRHCGRPAADITGVDCSEKMLAGARKSFAAYPEVKFVLGDAARLDAAGGTYHSVNIANAFHCLPDPAAVLCEMHRVLAPGGALAVNVLLYPRGWWPLRRVAEKINAWGIRKGILVTPYRIEDVRRMLAAAGFEVREERVSGNCLSLVAVKPV